jgi:hypothetical protein
MRRFDANSLWLERAWELLDFQKAYVLDSLIMRQFIPRYYRHYSKDQARKIVPLSLLRETKTSARDVGVVHRSSLDRDRFWQLSNQVILESANREEQAAPVGNES